MAGGAPLDGGDRALDPQTERPGMEVVEQEQPAQQVVGGQRVVEPLLGRAVVHQREQALETGAVEIEERGDDPGQIVPSGLDRMHDHDLGRLC